MWPVLLLFLIPIGGGIPAGVLLARDHRLGWPVMLGLYFVSDVILALLFEPVMRLVIALGKRIPALSRAADAARQATARTAAHYGGVGAGPFTLILIAFGVDPMTGRAAAAAAGHGFLSGWTLAIAGDMIYFAVIMVATLRLSAMIGDPNRTMAIILVAMIVLPMLVRRVKAGYTRRARSGFTLLELMVVVAVIGILAAIAIPKFATMIRKSQEGACKGNLGAIRGALSVYYGDMEGQYPTDMSTLTINAKYMPAIPVAKTPDYHADASWQHVGTVLQFSDNGNWQYDNVTGDANFGGVWVNCTHTDTKGSVWSAY